jgi:hypothetical protein
MGTILSILDFIVLLLLALAVLRRIWKELQQGPGSLLLTICVALALAVLAFVSLASYQGLVGVVSSLTQGIFLLILLVMAVLLRFTWAGKPAS